jgi:hypothetical protein
MANCHSAGVGLFSDSCNFLSSSFSISCDDTSTRGPTGGRGSSNWNFSGSSMLCDNFSRYLGHIASQFFRLFQIAIHIAMAMRKIKKKIATRLGGGTLRAWL